MTLLEINNAIASISDRIENRRKALTERGLTPEGESLLRWETENYEREKRALEKKLDLAKEGAPA